MSVPANIDVALHWLERPVPVALDLVALDVAARWLGIASDARLLDGLSIMEREALKLMRTEQ